MTHTYDKSPPIIKDIKINRITTKAETAFTSLCNRNFFPFFWLIGVYDISSD